MLKLKPEFTSSASQFTIVRTVPQLGDQCPERGLGGESSTKSMVVAAGTEKQVAKYVQLSQNKSVSLEISVSSQTLTHASQQWKMVSATLPWGPER